MSEMPSGPEIEAHVNWRQEATRKLFAAGQHPHPRTKRSKERERLVKERQAAYERHRARPWDDNAMALFLRADLALRRHDEGRS